MTKAKMLLGGIAMVAVLGAGPAFKSAKAMQGIYYTTTAKHANTSSICNLSIEATTTTGATFTTLATL